LSLASIVDTDLSGPAARAAAGLVQLAGAITGLTGRDRA